MSSWRKVKGLFWQSGEPEGDEPVVVTSALRLGPCPIVTRRGFPRGIRRVRLSVRACSSSATGANSWNPCETSVRHRSTGSPLGPRRGTRMSLEVAVRAGMTRRMHHARAVVTAPVARGDGG